MFTALESNTLAVRSNSYSCTHFNPARPVEAFSKRLDDAMRRATLLDRSFLFDQNLVKSY